MVTISSIRECFTTSPSSSSSSSSCWRLCRVSESLVIPNVGQKPAYFWMASDLYTESYSEGAGYLASNERKKMRLAEDFFMHGLTMVGLLFAV